MACSKRTFGMGSSDWKIKNGETGSWKNLDILSWRKKFTLTAGCDKLYVIALEQRNSTGVIT
jgi:hypothetical protein